MKERYQYYAGQKHTMRFDDGNKAVDFCEYLRFMGIRAEVFATSSPELPAIATRFEVTAIIPTKVIYGGTEQ